MRGTDGSLLATGRNRLHEHDAGDDVLAGSSLAHAEMNVLAKLRYRAHDDDDAHPYTTLQPCVQCLAAIRLSPIRVVHVLAPDPLWRGIEAMRDLHPIVAANWPEIVQLDVSEWSVLALLVPTMHLAPRAGISDVWSTRLPALTALATRVTEAGTIADLDEAAVDVVGVALHMWDDLTRCVPEVEALKDVDDSSV